MWPVTFIATYDTSKRADARFVVGSDLRISPGARPRTAAYASRLRSSAAGDVSAASGERKERAGSAEGRREKPRQRGGPSRR